MATRLQGSAGMHLLLIVRDVFVYKSMSPFTFEAMMNRARRKLEERNGTDVDDNDACSALIHSSIQTSKGFNAMAEEQERQQFTYVWEIVLLYGLVLCGVAALTWPTEVLCARCSEKQSKTD